MAASRAGTLTRPLKVCILTEFFPASERVELTGGVEARCFYVSRAMPAGCEVTVLARRTDGAVWEWASAGSLFGRLSFLARTLLDGIRADADVIEGTNQAIGPLAVLLGILKRRPVVVYQPDVFVGSWRRDFGWIGVLGEATERLLLRLPVTRFITTTEAVAEKMVANGVKRDRITIIPCGFDPSVAARLRRENPAREYDVAIVNRLVGYKHVDVVIRALALIAEQRPQLRAIVVGQGPELENLRRLADSLGVRDNVEFAGHVPEHESVLQLLNRSRLLVSASTVEGFGIVLAEAMGLGVPFVVSDIPAFNEVTLGGRGGRLVQAGDDAGFAREISDLLDDPRAYARASAEALELSRRYEWPNIAAQTLATWQSAVNGDRLLSGLDASTITATR